MRTIGTNRRPLTWNSLHNLRMADFNSVKARFDAISSRLDDLAKHPTFKTALRARNLQERQLAILQRIDKLMQALNLDLSASTVCPKRPSLVANPPHRPRPTVTLDASPTQQRLERELINRGFSSFRFVRVPTEYYDLSLELRRDCLGAASVNHLCKSIVMENTRAHESVTGWDDPRNSKYYCVIVQVQHEATVVLASVITGMNADYESGGG
ncbi:hypothetical protein Vretifemale_11767 [Volvox reticuliferus]|uniref:Uncharacterized protein n=1 Tax=Volvox reticuliferus TaxID=1737510 RepID=A0A8J4FQ91_9CHLO|nr:hypothetical protein Vretifemale_11767 [Volvox reticuliferus]